MHYDSDQLPWRAWRGDGWFRAQVTLTESDTAWNPGSTKHVVYGPAVVTYERDPSGQTVAIVEDVK